jgi:hypothetical protein
MEVSRLIIGVTGAMAFVLACHYQRKARSPAVMAKVAEVGWWNVFRPAPLPPKRFLGQEELRAYNNCLCFSTASFLLFVSYVALTAIRDHF